MKKHLLFRNLVLAVIIAISGLLISGCSQDDFYQEYTETEAVDEATRAYGSGGTMVDGGTGTNLLIDSWFCTKCGFWADGTKCWVCGSTNGGGTPTLIQGPWYEGAVVMSLCTVYRLNTPMTQRELFDKSWTAVGKLIDIPHMPGRPIRTSELKAICDKYKYDNAQPVILGGLNGRDSVVTGMVPVGVQNACDAAFDIYSKVFGPLQP